MAPAKACLMDLPTEILEMIFRHSLSIEKCSTLQHINETISGAQLDLLPGYGLFSTNRKSHAICARILCNLRIDYRLFWAWQPHSLLKDFRHLRVIVDCSMLERPSPLWADIVETMGSIRDLRTLKFEFDYWMIEPAIDRARERAILESLHMLRSIDVHDSLSILPAWSCDMDHLSTDFKQKLAELGLSIVRNTQERVAKAAEQVRSEKST